MEFEVENRGNSIRKLFQKAIIFQLPFLMDLGSILEGFGAPNGGQDGPKMGKLGFKKSDLK